MPNGFVPRRVGGRDGFHRRQAQAGMVGAVDAASACGHCGSLVALCDQYEGWCVPCVLKWGHPDDAADASRMAHGWTEQAALSRAVAVTDRTFHPTTVRARLGITHEEWSTGFNWCFGEETGRRRGRPSKPPKGQLVSVAPAGYVVIAHATEKLVRLKGRRRGKWTMVKKRAIVAPARSVPPAWLFAVDGDTAKVGECEGRGQAR